MGEEGRFPVSCLRVALVAPLPHGAVIVPLEVARDSAERSQIRVLYLSAGHALSCFARPHAVCYHGCPIEVFVVGRCYMVQRVPTNDLHLLGKDLEQLSMEE